MSEKPTGTDRVELTVCIPGQCCRGYCVDDTLHDLTKDQADRVRDVVAVRVQALAAERDEQRAIITQLRGNLHACPKQQKAEAERDAARARLAAANTRCAELERDVKNVTRWAMTREAERDALQARLDRLSTEIMDQNAEKWGDQPLTDDEKALLLRFNALSVVLDKSEAKNAALQATLDRVTASCTCGATDA